MAYMDQEKKRAIKAELIKVMPEGWKYSLSVRNYSTLELTIRSAPINLLKCIKFRGMTLDEALTEEAKPRHYWNVNPYYIKEGFTDENIAGIFEQIRTAMNLGNWDRSEPMTDYFDVGHYVSIEIGKWDKPFEVKGGQKP